jgi:hypothetical protein
VGLSRARLVIAHQARVADDIDGEDRGETTTGSVTAYASFSCPRRLVAPLSRSMSCAVPDPFASTR